MENKSLLNNVVNKTTTLNFKFNLHDKYYRDEIDKFAIPEFETISIELSLSNNFFVLYNDGEYYIIDCNYNKFFILDFTFKFDSELSTGCSYAILNMKEYDDKSNPLQLQIFDTWNLKLCCITDDNFIEKDYDNSAWDNLRELLSDSLLRLYKCYAEHDYGWTDDDLALRHYLIWNAVELVEAQQARFDMYLKGHKELFELFPIVEDWEEN